ncbi:MAG: hypothetical protein BECKG1743F_GA0114225_101357 [Candidatus Kentron sp. G]|nr:MAG: hypothetical protein BECKG1743F_GA0114225_101357 [Candidatus Kentron sp. G]
MRLPRALNPDENPAQFGIFFSANRLRSCLEIRVLEVALRCEFPNSFLDKFVAQSGAAQSGIFFSGNHLIGNAPAAFRIGRIRSAPPNFR